MAVRNELSAGGIIYRLTPEGVEVLLIKDHKGRWTFPKGHVEEGEDPATAAIREVEEETGLGRLTVRGEVGKTDYFFKNRWDGTNETVHKTVRFYLLEADPDAEPNPPRGWSKGVEPIADAKWFKVEEANRRSGYKDKERLLAKATQLIKQSRQELLLK